MTGLYAATISQNKREARQKMTYAQKCFDGLQNKTSTYACEVLALIEIYKKICAVYDDAPSELQLKNTLGEQVKQAQAEYDSWPEEKRTSVQLEGGKS